MSVGCKNAIKTPFPYINAVTVLFKKFVVVVKLIPSVDLIITLFGEIVLTPPTNNIFFPIVKVLG
jgi:hypothetical protein